MEIAKKFAEEGANIVISDIHEEKSKYAVLGLQEKGYSAIAAACDVTNEEEYKNSLELACQRFGTIVYLVNNAGLRSM